MAHFNLDNLLIAIVNEGMQVEAVKKNVSKNEKWQFFNRQKYKLKLGFFGKVEKCHGM